MSPLKRKKLRKIRFQLDKLDNSLIKVIKKRTNLVKKVLMLKENKNQIVDQKRIQSILRNIKKKSSRNNIEYDFEEAEEDNSDNIMPSGLSVENNEDQQQLDLAIMYFEMDNKKRALDILNNIINKIIRFYIRIQ